MEVTVSSVTSLKDIVDQVNQRMPDSSIIVAVTLNGKQLEEDWMTRQQSLYVMEEDTLELEARQAEDLGREAFRKSHEQFELICEDFQRIAEMFRLDDETLANTFLAQAVDNLQSFLRIVQESLILMRRTFSELTIDGKPAPQFIEQFSTKLSEVINIQKNNDWVLLADVIEYDLVPLLGMIECIYQQA